MNLSVQKPKIPARNDNAEKLQEQKTRLSAFSEKSEESQKTSKVESKPRDESGSQQLGNGRGNCSAYFYALKK